MVIDYYYERHLYLSLIHISLTVTPSANAEGETVSADVILSYDYKMPVFGIEKTHMTRGIAR